MTYGPTTGSGVVPRINLASVSPQAAFFGALRGERVEMLSAAVRQDEHWPRPRVALTAGDFRVEKLLMCPVGKKILQRRVTLF